MPVPIGYTPIEVAVALSLYAYNVDAGTRAHRLYDHFQGACLDSDDMIDLLQRKSAYAATELPYPTAKVYVEHALARYGQEARERCAINETAPI